MHDTFLRNCEALAIIKHVYLFDRILKLQLHSRMCPLTHPTFSSTNPILKCQPSLTSSFPSWVGVKEVCQEVCQVGCQEASQVWEAWVEDFLVLGMASQGLEVASQVLVVASLGLGVLLSHPQGPMMTWIKELALYNFT